MSAIIIVITATLGVLLTVAGVAGVWLALRTGQHTQTVKNFREATASWREKAEALASDLDGMRAEMTVLSERYDRLKARYDVLESVVTGEADFERLSVKLDGVQSAVVLEIRLNRALLQQLLAQNDPNEQQGDPS